MYAGMTSLYYQLGYQTLHVIWYDFLGLLNKQ